MREPRSSSSPIATERPVMLPSLSTRVVRVVFLSMTCPGLIRRGGAIRSNWGQDWRRSMAFTIPVRDTAFWQQDVVQQALCTALGFVSDDVYRFTFIDAPEAPPLEAYLPLANEASEVFAAEEVMLFSGGSDSLAGAVETLETTDRRVVLVRLAVHLS